MADRNALSTQEVADMLKVSKSTIYDMIKKGEIKSYKVGRKVRFTEADVKEYITNSKNVHNVNSQANSNQDFSLRPENKSNGFILCGQDLILLLLYCQIICAYMEYRLLGLILAVMTVWYPVS